MYKLLITLLLISPAAWAIKFTYTGSGSQGFESVADQTSNTHGGLSAVT